MEESLKTVKTILKHIEENVIINIRNFNLLNKILWIHMILLSFSADIKMCLKTSYFQGQHLISCYIYFSNISDIPLFINTNVMLQHNYHVKVIISFD